MRVFIVAVLLLIMACEADQSPMVIIQKEAGRIAIRNRSIMPVYYAAFERQSLATINWAAICGEGNRVRPNTTSTIPVTDSSFVPSDEAVVFWWSECSRRVGSEILVGTNLQSTIVKVR